MNLDKLLLHRMFNFRKGSTTLMKKGVTFFASGNSKKSYKQHLANKSIFSKKYLITDSTKERISHMPIDKISPKDFSFLDKKSGEVGFVLFNNNEHFIYSIHKNEIIILSAPGFSNRLLTDSPYILTNGDVYINYLTDIIQYNIKSPLSVFYDDETKLNDTISRLDKGELTIIRKILKENKGLENTKDIHKSNGIITKKYIELHNKKLNSLQLALKSFVFIMMAKVYDKTFIADDSGLNVKDIIRKKNSDKKSDIIKIDSKWDSNIKVINPFNVRGHFRKQPYGEKRSMIKTIYIDSFMKHGYTSKAKIYSQ